MPGVERAFWRWILLIWIVTVGWIVTLSWSAISGFRIPDPDDIMRLVEVRDWMGGQSWFDVSQHRMNPPAGLSMHWSRLVDLPVAALIAVARLFGTERSAETFAAVAVPMLTLGCAMALVAALTRRWTPAPLALFGSAICPMSAAVWFALRPMRIDHHGWQIVAGLGIVTALTAAPARRNAAIAGLCAALWTHISLEGLPFGAAAAAWLGLRAIMGTKADIDRLSAFLAAFTIGAATLLLAVKGPAAFAGLHCDAISTVHLAALGAATLTSLIAARASRGWAIAILIAGAAADALFYRIGAGSCMAGPFGQLGPLGQHLWYRSVNEGMPLWRLPLELFALWGPLPIVGLAGAVLAWVRTDRSIRAPLATYIVLLAAATGIGAFVMRASAFSNMLAMPGAMMLLLAIVRAVERATPSVRIVTITIATFVCSPWGPALACGLIAAQRTPEAPLAPPKRACASSDDFAILNRLPATIVIAPLGEGPSIIAASHQRAITGPYHRDPQALEDLLRFFTASPDEARAVALGRHATLLAFCPGDHDLAVMAAFAPRGLAAAIAHGGVPWLRRIALPGSSPLQVYRIDSGAPPPS
ncbi:hypothetical protein Q4F19_15455 [Sphingomonas sp. BIUV-7]|uniref:Uncharacterized protein n=1 Tax=Sphingomonas natans TaxID=3063330 RepID=A0ABT8YBR8_9SPHN|nr:hypothetical protein [Sphingomonas sp. BIUV-7]MDO6415787.1 hypothetical protein [Sphingomonas sp. BIUV-7]